MANSNATGLRVLAGFTRLATPDVNMTGVEWLANHIASFFSSVAVPLLRRLATALTKASELRRGRWCRAMRIAAGTIPSVPTTVAVAQDFLTPWPAPLPRNRFVAAGAWS